MGAAEMRTSELTRDNCVKGAKITPAPGLGLAGITEGKIYTVTCDYSETWDVTFFDDDGDDRCRRLFEFLLVTEDSLATQVGGSHYTDMVIQPLEYCIKNNIPFAEGNVIKYVSRWRKKNGIEDLRKAHDCLGKLIAIAELTELRA